MAVVERTALVDAKMIYVVRNQQVILQRLELEMEE